jgi:predicted exporter
MSYASIELFYAKIFGRKKIKINHKFFDKIFSAFEEIDNKLKKNTLFLLCLLTICFAFCVIFVKVQDDIRSFYVPSEKLRQEEALFLNVSGVNLQDSLLLIEGNTLDEILEKEESIVDVLRKNDVANYIAISSFIASKKRQLENYELMQKLYDSQAKRLADILGISKKIELKKPPTLLSIDSIKTVQLFSAIEKLIYETKTKKLFSTILLKDSKLDDDFIKNHSDIKPLSIAKEITKVIKSYREQMTKLLVVTALLLFIALALIYDSKNAIKLIIPPLTSIAATMVALHVTNAPINLFHIIGMFVVIGLGVDYAIFKFQSQARHTSIAILLSCLTSAFSLGSLSLTTFQITKSLGIVLCLGILLSFVFTNMVINGGNKKSGAQ